MTRNPKADPAPRSWSYRGHEITVDKYAAFQARRAGNDAVLATAGSFDTIKKKIDEFASFEPFKAFGRQYAHADIEIVTVTGIARSVNGRAWVDDRGREYGQILRATPANKKRLVDYDRARSSEDKRHGAAKAALGKLADAIEWETVEC